MFGYITINKQELKFKEFDIYRSFYCGLCKTLYDQYGIPAQFALSYDCTFLVMFLTGLYEPEYQMTKRKCPLHCVRGVLTNINPYTEYVADMTILLAYYKCMDDWKDEHKVDKLAYGKLLESAFKKVRERYPEKCERIQILFDKLSTCEKQEEYDLDKVSGLFGEILAECFHYRDDEWTEHVCRTAFFLGKFVYLMDAYEDLDKDIRKGSYNPFKAYYQNEDYETKVHDLLFLMMSECSKEFEKLPIIEHVEIMRNIIYSGVWCKYELLQIKKKKEESK